MSNPYSNGTGPAVSENEPPIHSGGFPGFESAAEGAEVSSPEVEEAEFSDDVQEDFEEVEEDAVEEEIEVAPEAASKRVNKRIRQLNDQKKDLANENEELKALVEQLKKSNEIQTQMQQRQQQYWNQQDEVAKSQQRRQLMLQHGLNPEDSRDAIAFQQMEYKTQLETQIQELQNRFQEQQNAMQIERFNSALSDTLNKSLASYNVAPEVLGAIQDTAYDIASIRGLTAAEAAAEAINRYKNVLPKKRSVKSSDSAAARAVSMPNRTKGKAPSKKGKDVDFLTMLASGDIFE